MLSVALNYDIICWMCRLYYIWSIVKCTSKCINSRTINSAKFTWHNFKMAITSWENLDSEILKLHSKFIFDRSVLQIRYNKIVLYCYEWFSLNLLILQKSINFMINKFKILKLLLSSIKFNFLHFTIDWIFKNFHHFKGVGVAFNEFFNGQLSQKYKSLD